MIRFVICGLEHSGTTLVSELLRQVPGIDAGFEIGVLLADNPRAFPTIQPYAEHMLWGWGLTEQTFASCCDTEDFPTFYARLHAASTVLRPNTHVIYDKTPRYLAFLGACMDRIRVPFIVTYKDPRSTVFSDFKASGWAEFDPWFESYVEEKRGYMRMHYREYARAKCADDPRVHFVRLEELCLHPRLSCARLFAHVGLRFDISYLAFRPERYQNTRVNSIAAGIPFEYVTGLGATRSRHVAKVFAEFSDWFFE